MASNIIVARGGVEYVPPISLAFWRWTLVFLILLPFTYVSLKKNYNHFDMGIYLTALNDGNVNIGEKISF